MVQRQLPKWSELSPLLRTKPIELDVEFLGEGKDPWGGTRVGVEAKGQLSRKEFGIDFNIPLEGDKVMIGDKITLLITAEAVLQA